MDLLSSIFLSPEISIEIFLEFLLLLILSYTFLQAIYILKNYNYKATTELQYKLEKKSYLINVVITISFLLKIILLFFFLYSLDELSLIVPGAMCAAGIINSNNYGDILLILKLFILLLSSIWLILNKADLLSINSLYFKKKIFLFIIIYIFILLELVLNIKFFSSIETQNPVLCCSSIYSSLKGSNPFPFNMSKLELILLFYLLYISIVFSAYKKYKFLLFTSVSAFIYISYFAIVYYFSAYIYELPTHKCPFCILQKEYHYVGYLIYISLFLAVYNSLSFSYKKVIFYFSLFVVTLSVYFIIYLIYNRTFL